MGNDRPGRTRELQNRRNALSGPTQEVPELEESLRDQTELVLTVLHHPDPDRVGERAVVDPSGTAISRTSPDFARPGGEPWPLADPFVSRSPLHVRGEGPVTVRSEGVSVSVDGVALEGERTLSRETLLRGVVLELGGRVVLLLHYTSAGATPVGPTHGLVGESTAMVNLRRTIAQVAPTPVPVLLRGETGSGKELVAQALHAASPRASGPCLSVNLAAVASTVAASELFGHAKGAFTGATGDHVGFFARAHGGTLFLDEIGEAPVEVQVMLLRTLETGVVRPVGGREDVQVDVRLVTATDADLERAAEEGRFRPALLHRLAGYEIHLPPLRERRDDLGRLLVHFLREELARVGAPEHLAGGQMPKTPWLSAAVVARLALYDWPGNVRQLRNVARHLAISGRELETLTVDRSLERLLAAAPTGPTRVGDARPRESTPVPVAEPEAPAQARRKPSEVTDEELLAALRKHRFRLEPTAVELRITRPSLYMLIDKSTRLRKAKDIPRDELAALSVELDGDVDAMAERLEVSSRGLYLRLRELERSSS